MYSVASSFLLLFGLSVRIVGRQGWLAGWVSP
jgi:hypothetical protein